jgi:hypothetical protein
MLWKLQVCSSRAKLWKKRRLSQLSEKLGNESLDQFLVVL